jgi:hypothetical protein
MGLRASQARVRPGPTGTISGQRGLFHVAVMSQGDFWQKWRSLKISGNVWGAMQHEKATFATCKKVQHIDIIA